jgi:protocatechuate 3,4-dioxygenase beta subunit
MSDIYKLGQSQAGSIKKVGEEIRLDIRLSDNPFLTKGTIFGKIVDSNNKPIQGALIKIMDNKHNPLYHALTDIDGNYTLNDLEPGSEYHFYAVKNGYMLKEEKSFTIEAGQIVEKNSILTIDPNAKLSTITAHILDEKGTPIENVMVTLFIIIEEKETPIAVTSSNRYGQGVFVNVELGKYIVRITKQGYEPDMIEIKITEPGAIMNIDIVLTSSPSESQGTINGTIIDNGGNPVLGAVVILYKASGNPENPILTPIRYTKTSTNGAYLFGEVPSGDYIVKSNKEN